MGCTGHGCAPWQLLHGLLLVSHGFALRCWGHESPLGRNAHRVGVGGEDGAARRSHGTPGRRRARSGWVCAAEPGVVVTEWARTAYRKWFTA